MENFKEIPNQLIINYLIRRIGNQAAIYDVNLFNLMRRFAPEVYSGGLWEVREYPNNAFAYILADSDVVPEVQTDNQAMVSCSIEALSLAANLYQLGGLCSMAHERGEEDKAVLFSNLRDALYDAIIGKMRFVVDGSNRRDPKPEELDQSFQPHPECDAILAIIS